MAQLSIFEKQRHYSTKDFTCSVGKYDYIYITFRNHSWKRFTSSDKISVEIKNNVLVFGDPEEHPEARSYKLRRTRGDIETTEHTRYLQISGKSWPAFLEAARNMSGSFSFDDAPTIKNVSEEDIEKLKELLANAGPAKLEPFEDTVPKGFIIVHDADSLHFANLIPIDWITGVHEEAFEQASISLNHGNICATYHVDESFADVINLMCKASEV